MARQLEHFPNLVTMFLARAAEKGDAPFLWAKRDGGWQSTSWNEAARQVAALAESLKRIGLEPGDRVDAGQREPARMADRRPRHHGRGLRHRADLHHQHDAAITPISWAIPAPRAVIVSNQKLAKTLVPAVLFASAIATTSSRSSEIRTGQSPDVARAATIGRIWSARRADMRRSSKREIAGSRRAKTLPASSTPAAPAARRAASCSITARSCTMSPAATDVISTDFGWDDEVFLSFLPASHAYEHTGGQHFPVGLGAQIYYAESLEKLAANIEEVRPTIMVVVPRLFEMLRARILKNDRKQRRACPSYLLSRALKIGQDKHEGRLKPWDLPMDGFLSLTLRARSRRRFGGRIKAMGVGRRAAQPRSRAVLPVARAARSSRAMARPRPAPVISCNRPSVGIRHGNGRPAAAQGHRGPDRRGRRDHGSRRDWSCTAIGAIPKRRRACSARTAWLATGDVGHFDDKGRIVITDRKKDLIVNDKGDNVSPQRIEGMLTIQPEIAQAMVYGDRRPAPRRVARSRPGDRRRQPMSSSGFSARSTGSMRTLSVIERVRRFIVADEAVHDRERAADAVNEDPAPRHQARPTATGSTALYKRALA